ncbi:MAG: phosphoserine phosphatase, partial [Pedobacter sp.]
RDDQVKVPKETLERAIKLKVIGCLGSSKNAIDVHTCTSKGIVVFDDPRQKKHNTVFIPNRMIDFMNSGATYMSHNFPNLQLPKIAGAHRLAHIHKNVPGIMAQMNTIFARHKINITGQFLMTNSILGYCITDIDKGYDDQILKELKKIEETIKFRILY